MQNLEDIRRSLTAALPGLKQRYPISELALFGSVVRGEAKPESDLDVLVDYSAPLSYFELASLRREIEEITGIRTDLALKSTLRRTIGQRILAEALPL